MPLTCRCTFLFFFFNDTATTEIYTLSLHDALPICPPCSATCRSTWTTPTKPSRIFRGSSTTTESTCRSSIRVARPCRRRSEEHTSELQSRQYLVCRLLLEKKKKNQNRTIENHHLI